MKIFLKPKHWQIFLLTFAILFMVALYSGLASHTPEEDRFVSDGIARFVTVVPFLVYFL